MLLSPIDRNLYPSYLVDPLAHSISLVSLPGKDSEGTWSRHVERFLTFMSFLNELDHSRVGATTGAAIHHAFLNVKPGTL